MALEKKIQCVVAFFGVVIVLLLSDAPSVIAGDIVHDDDSTPKKPGCENQFVLVNNNFTQKSSLLFSLFILVFKHGHGALES